MKDLKKKRDWDGDPLKKEADSPKLSSKSPKGSSKYSLREMLKKIAKDNLHPETDWGPPAGREIV